LDFGLQYTRLGIDGIAWHGIAKHSMELGAGFAGVLGWAGLGLKGVGYIHGDGVGWESWDGMGWNGA